MSGALRPLRVRYLGRVPYREAWALQRALVEDRKAGTIEDTLLLLEHDPVVTLGRDGSRASLLRDEAALTRLGVELVESDRGGDATVHGPGQVVAYPILDLRPDRKDVRRYVRDLEQSMIDTCADYGLTVGRLDGAPGVWLAEPDRKIGALGCRLSRWVTMHGVALNANTDLRLFDLIVPCGLHGKGVTSLAAELGHRVSMVEVMERLAGHVARRFGRTVVADAEIGQNGPSLAPAEST
ncbi:MAG: lipoyl(octanoyl) transferase LipB [Myxococcales bacterium]|nr:lipoyl(octanoyl) transferase LipB [Myxococcales bacterium]